MVDYERAESEYNRAKNLVREEFPELRIRKGMILKAKGNSEYREEFNNAIQIIFDDPKAKERVVDLTAFTEFASVIFDEAFEYDDIRNRNDLLLTTFNIYDFARKVSESRREEVFGELNYADYGRMAYIAQHFEHSFGHFIFGSIAQQLLNPNDTEAEEYLNNLLFGDGFQSEDERYLH